MTFSRTTDSIHQKWRCRGSMPPANATTRILCIIERRNAKPGTTVLLGPLSRSGCACCIFRLGQNLLYIEPG